MRFITDVGQLLSALNLPQELSSIPEGNSNPFPLKVSESFAARISPKDPNDPLLLQVLPSKEELNKVPGFSPDPLEEGSASVTKNLLSKYKGRVLLSPTGVCPIHCRFCFRRHYKDIDHKDLEASIEAIRSDKTISEVILSGGDPLMLSKEALLKLVTALADIPHLKRLRVHTRVPVAIPEEIDSEMVSIFRNNRLTTLFVIHANHPNELDDSVKGAVKEILKGGITILSQSVLLKGINDDSATLGRLFEALVDIGVTPYYLHNLDKVAGAAHFYVEELKGKEILGILRETLPGYMVPRYVKEVPGSPCKVAIL
ncbi:MAG: KamA family radical SAM protein [Nitrospinae bacterium]|nr:KamA family radical SAM protein [Nitrospinota bacterium]